MESNHGQVWSNDKPGMPSAGSSDSKNTEQFILHMYNTGDNARIWLFLKGKSIDGLPPTAMARAHFQTMAWRQAGQTTQHLADLRHMA